MRLKLVIVPLALAALLSACAVSRQARLESKARRVESRLVKERQRVLAMPPSDESRAARLEHLSQLRTTLSAANIGLGTVPLLFDPAHRPMAYDVLEEVYSTIDWNIPLGPEATKRALPASFAGNTLKLHGSTAPSPLIHPIAQPDRSTP